MDNVTLTAEGGPAVGRRVTTRLVAFVVSLGGIVAMAVLFSQPASAQFGFGGFADLICDILLALANSLPAFFGNFLEPFLQLFGCLPSP